MSADHQTQEGESPLSMPTHDWFSVQTGFWRSLWLLVRGRRIREWRYMAYADADLNEVDW